MKIAVIGTGYVGLVTGTCFAETGNDVICVDIDREKVQKMKDGKVPIYEPHLDVLFQRNIRQGRLKFTTDIEEIVEDDQIILKQGERHRLIGLDEISVVAEIWQHTDATHPSDEDDIIRVQDDFGR